MVNNLPMLFNMLRSSGNPQSMLMNMVSKQANNNPIMQNVLGMMQNGNTNGIEQIARNLAKEKNIDIDTMLNQIKKQF